MACDREFVEHESVGVIGVSSFITIHESAGVIGVSSFITIQK